MTKLNSKQIKALAKEEIEALEQLEQAKAIYKKLDEVTEKVLSLGVDLSAHGIAMVDNFDGKNKVWKPAAVARFELKKVV